VTFLGGHASQINYWGSILHQEAPEVAKSKSTQRAKSRPAPEPDHHDLIRQPDVTGTVTVRFTCGVYVRVTHPDYSPHDVLTLLGQGQVQLEPLAPGHVGTLILDGFPYTVLGYYTFSAEDANYEHVPAGWWLYGTTGKKARRKPQRDGAKVVKRRRHQDKQG
jgi:hypothetical protein